MVCTVEPCLIMVVGVTGRVSSDAPGAYRTAGDMIYFTDNSPFWWFLTCSSVILKLDAKLHTS